MPMHGRARSEKRDREPARRDVGAGDRNADKADKADVDGSEGVRGALEVAPSVVRSTVRASRGMACVVWLFVVAGRGR